MKLFRFVLVAFSLVLLSLPTFAQDTESAEWGNLGIFVDFPSDWEVDDSGENAALVLFNDDIIIMFYEPWTNFDDAEEAILAIGENEDFEFEEIEDYEILGEDAFLMRYANEDYAGFVISFEFDDQVLVLEGYVLNDQISSSEEDSIFEVIETLNTDGDSGGDNAGGSDELDFDADNSSEAIVAELVDLGLVEDGGEFLFEEDEVINITDLPESYEGGNIAMGALISWEVVDDDEDYRFCTLVSQSSTNDLSGEEGTALVVGFGSDSLGILAEFDLENFDNSIIESFDAEIEIEDQNHLLIIVSNDELSVYVNGEVAVEAWELDLTAGDDELFAGFISNLGCDMQNVWAYTFE